MEKKCVMVIDSELPLGLIANTSAVLALSLGKKIEGIIGSVVIDGDGHTHEGITTTPIPILKSSQAMITELQKTISSDYPNLFLVGFSNIAQLTKNYDDYMNKIASSTTGDIRYLGIAVYGNKKDVNKLTGSLPLLR